MTRFEQMVKASKITKRVEKFMKQGMSLEEVQKAMMEKYGTGFSLSAQSYHYLKDGTL
jgi:cytochrome c-type biogenesis protein CcmH/NrfF